MYKTKVNLKNLNLKKKIKYRVFSKLFAYLLKYRDQNVYKTSDESA